jgi:cob(I)alamin adenosyltransferase
MKIYTRTGDKGETSLIGGNRIPKNNPRIIAYGTVDELNSYIGLIIALMAIKPILSDIVSILIRIQKDLFIIGADLADPSNRSYDNSSDQYTTPHTEDNMIAFIESEIDKFESELSPITFFILPGGSIEGAYVHISRSIARRCEIAVVALSKQENVNPAILRYVNRLSDLLFVIARVANKRHCVEDIAWKGSRNRSP